MTQVMCSKYKCLNNRKGYCSAVAIEYDGLCQTYFTSKDSSKASVGICRRGKGKLVSTHREILK